MTKERAAVNRPFRRSARQWWRAVLAAALVSLLTAAGLVVVTSVVAPAPAGAVTSCGASPAYVHYKVAAAPTSSTFSVVISAVTLSHLTTTCDGKAAKLTFFGNPAGDPSTPATTTLSTATSSVDSCTGSPVATGEIRGGTITLHLCMTPNPPKKTARYVSVLDLTRLTLTVGGIQVVIKTPTSPSNSTPTPTTTAVGPKTGSSNGSGSGGSHNVPVSTSATTTGGSLAFTGAEIAAMTAGGLVIVLLGLLLILVSRRRRQTTGGTP